MGICKNILGGSVIMMGGLSWRADFIEILSQNKDICKYAIVESFYIFQNLHILFK